MQPKLVVGAHVVVYINNQQYGYCYDLEYSSDTPRRPLKTVDYLHTIEHIPESTHVSGTIGIYRGRGRGGVEGAGLTATYPDLSREKYFSILIIDRVTDTVLFRADNCSLVRQSWRMPSRGYVTGTISFDGLLWNNEVGPSF